MKKFIKAVACCIILAACSNENANTNADSVESASLDASTDSASVDTIAVDAAIPDFMSDDLKAYAFRGPVKKVVLAMRSPDDFEQPYPGEMTFSQKGKNTTMFYDGMEESRNPEGIIEKLSIAYGTDGTWTHLKIHNLNEYGHPLKASYEYEGPGVNQVKGIFYFSDYVYDSHQNWISRKVKADYKLTDFETEASRNKKATWTETRRITYY